MTHPRSDEGGPRPGDGPRPEDRPRAGAPWRRSLRAFGAVMAAAGAVTLVLGAFPALQLLTVAGALGAAMTPYGTIAWLLAAACLIAAGGRRTRLVAVAAVAALVVQVAWTQPYWRRSPAAGVDAAPTLSVLVVNLRCDFAATADLVAVIGEEDPDVVVLVDVIPTVWRELPVLAGMESYRQTTRRSSQPESWEVPGEPCFTGVAARGPVALLATTDTANPQHVLRVDLPSGDLRLIAVDVENPLEGLDAWRADLAAVRGAVSLVEDGTPLAVVGDFNAVREHAPMVALRQDGLVDAAEQAGAGWVRTFPADWTVPPLLAIDHVMLRGGLTAVAVETFTVGGTDHLGLVVRIATTARDVAG